jgi:hypothetical protein
MIISGVQPKRKGLNDLYIDTKSDKTHRLLPERIQSGAGR